MQRKFLLFLLALAAILGVERFALGQAGKSPARPVITVEAVFPGASAKVVEDTVADLMEAVVNGVANMAHMRSQCTNDGTYKLAITFAPGVDLAEAQDNVRNRVQIVMNRLPPLVLRHGVATKRAPATTALLVKVHSPDGKYDGLYLSNYASINVHDELARLPGVSEVAAISQMDRVLRVWLDPKKLAATNITEGDVAAAIRAQETAAKIGKPLVKDKASFDLTIHLGRLLDATAFGNIIVKATPDGQVVRVKDVAKIEEGEQSLHGDIRQNGKSFVMLRILSMPESRPDEVSAAVRNKIEQLRKRCPEGVEIQVAYDFAPNITMAKGPKTPQYLLIDVDLPAAADLKGKLVVSDRCADLVSGVEGVKDVVSFVNNQACLLVQLTPSTNREQVKRAIRARLDEKLADTSVRLRDFTPSPEFPWHGGYSINLAVHGRDAAKVSDWAGKLAERMRQNKKLTACTISQDAKHVPQIHVEIDIETSKKQGVQLADIFNALELNSEYSRFIQVARSVQYALEPDGRTRDRIETIKQLKIRSADGKMVPLASLVSVKEFAAPLAINRFNGTPMVEITANHAPEATLAEVRKLCEALAEETRRELGLPTEYRLAWLE